jgi:hypothetical protein
VTPRCGAAPLWHTRPEASEAILRPDIVRFESDEFMQELFDELRLPPAERATALEGRAVPPAEGVRRLYQPVHGHFNLVLATLVCRVPGLPDHRVDAGQGDEVGFVIRRLHKDGRQMAWVAKGAAARAWLPLAPKLEDVSLAAGEEVFPMFPAPATDGDRTRRLWAGVIPTTSRDTFVATRAIVPDAFPESGQDFSTNDVRDPSAEYLELKGRVVEGLRMLNGLSPALASSASERVVEASRFFLLDLGDLLQTHLRWVWDATSRPSRHHARALYDLIHEPRASLGGALRPLMVSAIAERARIDGDATDPPDLSANVRDPSYTAAALASTLDAAYAEGPPPAPASTFGASAPAPPRGPTLPRFEDGEARYVVLCVYRRTRCRPPHPDIVGTPSSEFTIATVFDLDAPARPIRIALPVDTSLKGLRKLRKNVAFLLSDQLRKQVGQATDLQKLLDGEAPAGENFSLGEICSFSIPIITLCAFIILMIFMILLNFVFWWLPLLKFCFPIPRKGR